MTLPLALRLALYALVADGVFALYLGGVGAYRQICQKVADNDYEGFATS